MEFLTYTVITMLIAYFIVKVGYEVIKDKVIDDDIMGLLLLAKDKYDRKDIVDDFLFTDHKKRNVIEVRLRKDIKENGIDDDTILSLILMMDKY